MTNMESGETYTPLYKEGKRDKARRYVSSDGTIISRRKYIKISEKTTPEYKAYARYKAGLAPRGVTVKQVEKKLQRQDRKRRQKEKEKGITQKPVDETDMVAKLRAKGKRIARHDTYQLMGMYVFYNPELRKSAESKGYSVHVRGKRTGTDFLILREQATNYAKAQLPFSGWELVSVVWEKWLKW